MSRKNCLLHAALLLAPLSLGACSRVEGPNVLLISLDTLRADHLSSYGYERETTPFMDEQAAAGVRFHWAFVNTLATTNSHTTILSSQYQESHGVMRGGQKSTKDNRLPEELALVQESFQRFGYRTLGVTDGGNFAERHGFGRGFDEFEGKEVRGAQDGSKAFLDMLDRNLPSNQPLFLLFHTYEIHAPYDPPAPFDTQFSTGAESEFVPTGRNLRRVRDTASQDLTPTDLEHIVSLYDGGIRFTDSVLEDMFERLEERGFFDDDYLVVITADHGEEFGDHGGVLHRGLLYDELIRVPLIIKGSRLPGGEVRDDIISSIDIAPTLLAYAGVPIPESMQGRDLFSERRRPPHGEIIFAQLRSTRYALRTKEWKFIESEGIELYNLTTDPGETINVALDHLDRVAEFQGLIKRWREGQEGRRLQAGSTELSKEEIQELKALGYVE
jgi:arylsulfatase A-like enzyme